MILECWISPLISFSENWSALTVFFPRLSCFSPSPIGSLSLKDSPDIPFCLVPFAPYEVFAPQAGAFSKQPYTTSSRILPGIRLPLLFLFHLPLFLLTVRGRAYAKKLFWSQAIRKCFDKEGTFSLSLSFPFVRQDTFDSWKRVARHLSPLLVHRPVFWHFTAPSLSDPVFLLPLLAMSCIGNPQFGEFRDRFIALSLFSETSVSSSLVKVSSL